MKRYQKQDFPVDQVRRFLEPGPVLLGLFLRLPRRPVRLQVPLRVRLASCRDCVR